MGEFFHLRLKAFVITLNCPSKVSAKRVWPSEFNPMMKQIKSFIKAKKKIDILMPSFEKIELKHFCFISIHVISRKK